MTETKQVPVTEKMLEAGQAECPVDATLSYASLRAVFEAMLAAAPTTEPGEFGPVTELELQAAKIKGLRGKYHDQLNPTTEPSEVELLRDKVVDLARNWQQAEQESARLRAKVAELEQKLKLFVWSESNPTEYVNALEAAEAQLTALREGLALPIIQSAADALSRLNDSPTEPLDGLITQLRWVADELQSLLTQTVKAE